MKELSRTEKEEIEDLKFKRPHVVILGAGASLAAFPNGDRNEKILPVMDNLIEVVGLEPLLKNARIEHQGKNFEVLYSLLSKDPENAAVLETIEKHIFEYFSQLLLPDEPTLYDHLILSLRKKDCIATFNWDPLLVQAYVRVSGYTRLLPHLCFLHGNTGIGYCLHPNKVYWWLRDHYCGKCGETLKDSKLLFPIEKKSYTQDRFITGAWSDLKFSLKRAYMVTLFGYGAPKSDVEAIEVMKEAWGEAKERNLEEFEMINILSRDELRKTWNSFIHTHHYRTPKDFYLSFMANHPRRSCESMWSMLMQCDPRKDRPIPNYKRYRDLWEWFEPLIEVENRSEQSEERS